MIMDGLLLETDGIWSDNLLTDEQQEIFFLKKERFEALSMIPGHFQTFV